MLNAEKQKIVDQREKIVPNNLMNQKDSEKKDVENLVYPLTERKTAKIIRLSQHNTNLKFNMLA